MQAGQVVVVVVAVVLREFAASLPVVAVVGVCARAARGAAPRELPRGPGRCQTGRS